MLSFGQVKNSLEKLKSYLKKMDYFQPANDRIAAKDLQQQNLRLLHNQIFLPLLNFILISYSTDIYLQILDRLPNIKYKHDRNFLEDALNIARDHFKCPGTLSVDQFLTNKYFEKKLQFVSNLAKAVYDKAETLKKNKLKDKDKELNQYATTLDQYQFNNDLDDEEEELPMTITAQPIKLNVEQFTQKPPILNNRQTRVGEKDWGATKVTANYKEGKFSVGGEQFEQWEVEKAMERHPTPVHSNFNKPKEQPISSDRNRISKHHKVRQEEITRHQQQSAKEQEEDQFERFRLDQNKNKVKNSHRPQVQRKFEKHDQAPGQSQMGYVTIQKFNELVSLFTVVSQTINELSAKFVTLQSTMSTQMGNMNARVMMLENTVRLLKDNL